MDIKFRFFEMPQPGTEFAIPPIDTQQLIAHRARVEADVSKLKCRIGQDGSRRVPARGLP